VNKTFIRSLVILVALGLFSLACGLSSALPTATLPPPIPQVITVVITATLSQSNEALTPSAEVSPTPLPPPPIPTATASATATATLELLPPSDTPFPTVTSTPSGPFAYIVQEGDTLIGIAQKFNIDLAILLAMNPGIENKALKVGDQVFIPAPDTALKTPSAFTPVGFVADPHDGVGMKFYKPDGSLITELVAKGLSEYDSQRVHIGGPWQGDPGVVPVVYYSSLGPGGDNSIDWLWIVQGGSEPVLMKVPQFYAMAGAPGQPVLAYTTMDFEESEPRCRLYAASLKDLPGASPLFVIADPEGYMVRPLVVDAKAGKLKGIWYTMAAWGIGGDVVFEPRKGLKYLDMSSGMVDEILNRDMSAWDVSSDRNWVASSTMSGPLSIFNRRPGETYTFPLLASSNRGAGNARFAPDGLSVAWMEGSGWTMGENPNYHATIRIATTAGVVQADIPQAAFDGIASSKKITWVEPVGWLDDRTLVVQVRFQAWSDAALIRVNSDGSNPVYLASGTFVTFLYP
jgi:LysM repeat protein